MVDKLVVAFPGYMKLDKQAAIRFTQDTYDWLQAQSDRTGLAISDIVRQAVDLLMTEQSVVTVPFSYQGTMKDRQIGSDQVWLGSLYARLTAYDDGAVVLNYGHDNGSSAIWVVRGE
ncbi:hypothetical protein H6G17_24260 [Chroococcidiopsis sp. FACHB-1243]|uniref:hypothetical protein n=1 Tax=Chroococcidiopsis sp. [FACHB-1243] TaxID=2692781 RepID=UPI00177FB58F|nr:hypothetical protein [Chroococcidiopsis sp. [FACHB-1243]]MBD2308588.1 hypothetical protein [Chroococcidiopsis sp. [FACHB-1243]]